MALPQRHRLRGQRVFERIYRHGRRFQGSSLVLRVLAADASLLPADTASAVTSWRCGVVVSRKVSKLAVRRNRLRRLLHRHLLCHPPVPARPVWLLFTLRPGCVEAGEEQFLGECTRLLRQAGWLLDPVRHPGGQDGEEGAAGAAGTGGTAPGEGGEAAAGRSDRAPGDGLLRGGPRPG